MYKYPEPGRVVVIDIHQWSGVIKDWAKLKENAAAVLIKITNGRNISPYAKENWEGARKAGVPRGSWGWLYAAKDISVNAQARAAVDFLKDDPGELPFFCDFEATTYNYIQSNPSLLDLWSFLTVYERESGRVPGIYSGYYFWWDHGSTAPLYRKYPLWIANYGVTRPLIPTPWGMNDWMFHQFTDNGYGLDYGVDPWAEKAVDLNYFNGTLDDLNKLIGKPPTSRISAWFDKEVFYKGV